MVAIMNRSRRWSVAVAMLVLIKSPSHLVNRSRSRSIVDAIDRRRSDGLMVGINRCRCWRVVPAMVVGTRSSGRLAPTGRSGRRGVLFEERTGCSAWTGVGAWAGWAGCGAWP